MTIYHPELFLRWQNFSIFEQMANIGAEVGRTLSWKKRGEMDISKNAFYRALELIDLTIADKKNGSSLKEICRIRELLVDYCLGDNIYRSNDKVWEKYFYSFNFAARNHKT